jgi:type IV secretion system protein VirB5
VPAGAELPYLRGRVEFAGAFADLAKGKRNWQLAGFGLLGIALVLALGVVQLATQSRITPYVVEVDRLGRAQAFGPAEPLKATDQRVIVAQLASFIRDIRMVVADPVAQAELVRRAYAFVDQQAAGILDTYFAAPANDPRILGHDITRLVEVTSVLRVPGSSTWKVSWTETAIPRVAGGPPTVTAWEGYLTTRTVPPATTERITLNPLGLYIISLTWTQLGPRVPAADTLPTGLPSSDGVTP